MDAFQKLRPSPPTPAGELCHCVSVGPMLLMSHLSENPLLCMECRGEVPPERLNLSPDVAESVANWNHLFRAFETLWLDSGEYEEWARSILENPSSPVNARGLDVAQQLSVTVPTYYHLFGDATLEDWKAPTSCPHCGQQPTRVKGWLVCEECAMEIGAAYRAV
jgi:predicted  nucleic acid-binding Zn ribbon protein